MCLDVGEAVWGEQTERIEQTDIKGFLGILSAFTIY